MKILKYLASLSIGLLLKLTKYLALLMMLLIN